MMEVQTFMRLYVGSQYSNIFFNIMKEYDGSPSVKYAFYDMDVLKEKFKEAKDMV